MKKLFLLLCVICCSLSMSALNPSANKKGLWGYVNEKGKFVIKAQFEAAEPFAGDLAVVKKNGLYGYIDAKGAFVIQPEFEAAANHNAYGLAVVKKNGLCGLIDKQGNQVAQPAYEAIEAFVGKVAFCTRNGLKGVLNTEGREVVPCEYATLKSVVDCFVGSKPADSRVYYLSGADYAVEAYDKAEPLSPALIKVTRGEQLGCLSAASARVILPCRYAYIVDLGDMFRYGNADDCFGLMKKEGGIIKNIDDVQSATILQDGAYVLFTTSDKKQSLFSVAKAQNIIEPCESIVVNGDEATIVAYGSTYVRSISSGALSITVGGKKITTPAAASSIAVENGMIVWTDAYGKTAYMNKAGKPIFEDVNELSVINDKYCWIRYSSYWALAEIATGKELTDFHFTRVGGIENGWILCHGLRSTWNEGDMRIRIANGKVYYCDDGAFDGMVRCYDPKTEKVGFFTASGSLAIAPKYQAALWFTEGRAGVWTNGAWGFIDKSGKLVIPAKFAQVEPFGNTWKGFAIVMDIRTGGQYVIDRSGRPARLY